MSFKDELSNCRNQRKLSREEVSKITGLSLLHITLLETGEIKDTQKDSEVIVHKYCLIGCNKFNYCKVSKLMRNR